MQETGEVLGVIQSRASEVHSSAVLRLRDALRRERAWTALRTGSASR
jgi:DNA-directed RNA polymerase specialized sigma subunit